MAKSTEQLCVYTALHELPLEYAEPTAKDVCLLHIVSKAVSIRERGVPAGTIVFDCRKSPDPVHVIFAGVALHNLRNNGNRLLQD